MSLGTNFVSKSYTCFFILVVSSWLCTDVSYAQVAGAGEQNDTTVAQQTAVFPDEYSELDDNFPEAHTSDAKILETLEKSRQKYLKALILIDRGDTTNAAKYFNEAFEILNKISSYPEIEQDEDFNDLAQSIVEDYDSYIGNSQNVDVNSSLLMIREILAREVEDYTLIPTIDPISADSIQAIEDTYDGIFIHKDSIKIPMPTNEFVERNMKWWRKKKISKVMTLVLSRSSRWFPMMKKIAEEEGMPLEILYLTFIESGMRPFAVSRAKAVGMWQFMRPTGQEYGLNEPGTSYWVDERRDPEKSTKSAMLYLKDLYIRFGDWHLAFAAYNCGPGCVSRAIRRSKLKFPSFWEIRRWLPKETKNYVPAYIATAKIAMNPEAYGFKTDTIQYEDEFKYDTVRLHVSMNMTALAKCAEIALEDLQEYNSELIKGCTPPDMEFYDLKIPVGSKDRFLANLDSLDEKEKQPWIVYKIKKRASLKYLARRYRTSVKDIMAMNGYKSFKKRLRRGDEVKIPISAKNYNNSSVIASNADVPGNSVKNIYHKVRSGESLYSIARKHGIRLTDLRNLNNIAYRNDNIKVGRRLLIAKKTKKSQRAPKIQKLAKPIIVKHKVKRRESLHSISKKYDITVNDIVKSNKIKKNKIYPGQVLRIKTQRNLSAKQTIIASNKPTGKAKAKKNAKPKKGKTIVHRVKRGETVGTIAALHGVSERQLRKWNPRDIRRNKIFAGAKLKVVTGSIQKGSSSKSAKVKKSPMYYRIKRRDTFQKIARRYGLNLSKLRRLNKNVNVRKMQIGQKIRLR